jgi:hypothetical protein
MVAVGRREKIPAKIYDWWQIRVVSFDLAVVHPLKSAVQAAAQVQHHTIA